MTNPLRNDYKFDRFSICLAFEALENDWNHDGWLRERPSNQRRHESVGVQLQRMGFRAGATGGTFAALDHDARMCYIGHLIAFGLSPHVMPDDEIAEYVRDALEPEFVRQHFPQLR